MKMFFENTVNEESLRSRVGCAPQKVAPCRPIKLFRTDRALGTELTKVTCGWLGVQGCVVRWPSYAVAGQLKLLWGSVWFVQQHSTCDYHKGVFGGVDCDEWRTAMQRLRTLSYSGRTNADWCKAVVRDLQKKHRETFDV